MKTNMYFTLLTKELVEQMKNGKLIIFIFVFGFFGLLSPISAKFMPDIIASFTETQNIQIIVPEPTWLDAVGQYIKNLTQMCMFIAIIIYMGLISREKETGTLVFLLVKPVKRSTFILAKFSSVLIVAIISMIGSFVAASIFSYFYFDGFDIAGFAKLNMLMLLYLVNILFITVLFSSIFKSQIIAGILSFGAFLVLSLMAQIGAVSKFIPSGLMSEANNAIVGNPINAGVVISSFLFLVLSVILSIILFKKWEP
ncbi:MAG: ABC transporter permease subunit [Bacteroidales bacterium]|nr:ABC transporter permease subunit [Bacteroidales bacterium]